MLTPNAERFLSHNPTLIGVVDGDSFYEHPVYGDMEPLVVITKDGKKKHSCFYELPTREEYTQ